MTPASPEYQMIRTAIDWVLDAVVGDHADRLDHRRARGPDRITTIPTRSRNGSSNTGGAEVRRARARRQGMVIRGLILCFAGPPGVALANRSCAHEPQARIHWGVCDEAENRAVAALYRRHPRPDRSGYEAGRAMNLRSCSMRSQDQHQLSRRPGRRAVEALDPAQNHSFHDHYRDQPIPYASCHRYRQSAPGTIQPALIDRMEVISLAGYTEEEKPRSYAAT